VEAEHKGTYNMPYTDISITLSQDDVPDTLVHSGGARPFLTVYPAGADGSAMARINVWEPHTLRMLANVMLAGADRLEGALEARSAEPPAMLDDDEVTS